jgi:DnaJ-domain-containing protein 1
VATFDKALADALADIAEPRTTPGSFECSLRMFEAQLAEASARAVPDLDREIVLGLETPRTATELRRAFRRMALETHPDRPGGSHEAFLHTMSLYEQAERALATEARSAF